MNKAAIQKYAIWARNELIEQVKQRAYQYGISDKGYGDENATVIAGRVLSADEKRQRQAFVTQIKEHGYQQAVEEVAYTWFNRFIALRFMEVNDYLPTHVRVFSDASGGFSPEILKDVLHLDLDGLDKAKVSELINANKTEELYRYLLLTQCNALNEVLPEIFEHLGGYTEMLLPNSILKQDSVLARLVKDIPEDDFRDAVQIIGWMYQYYNIEPKRTVDAKVKKGLKVSKDELPAKTQLFTPDWIVRYMVENSLGRLWLESHPNAIMKANWKYYLDEAEQSPEVAERLCVLRAQSPVKSPEDIRLIDPCMGSGHILVYAFDVLMQIYESEGYNPRDAARLILEKNLYGLDIDRRAYQLAYFSLMMKARQYNRRIFTEGVSPQVYFPNGNVELEEFGSLLDVDKPVPKPELSELISLFEPGYEDKMHVWNYKRLLTDKYDIVVTNPPYMGGSDMNANLAEFVKKNYPDSKSDLFAVFIEKCGELLKTTGYQAMITQHAWMFLSSFEKLRGKLIHRDIVNMAHLGARAFEEIGGEIVQTTAFVLSKRNITDFEATYVRLVDYNSQQAKEEAFLSGSDRHTAKKENYEKIPGCPVAYWVSEAMLRAFESGKAIGDFTDVKIGMGTGKNEIFVREWWEVDHTCIDFSLKNVNELDASKGRYFPYNKGGDYRLWYGNLQQVLWFDAKGRNYMSTMSGHRENGGYNWYFKQGITWTFISSSKFGVRLSPYGFAFDVAGSTLFVNDDELHYVLGFLSSVVCNTTIKALNPTMNYQAGNIKSLPIVVEKKDSVDTLVKSNISLSRIDWDAFESSWDFKCHPLICGERTVAAAYGKWKREAAERFDTLKSNEEELNRIFIDIYGLQDELTPEVNPKDVTIRCAELDREIRSLINYAVGCMFGRYSLDVDGLAYAGGVWDTGKYKTLRPDRDNIIPVCDDEYFDDDVVGRFVEFVRVVYGTDALEENLRFIADALGGRGTPREVIRSYFLNDFYKDHCKIYQKRPIYWLFDSGKKNSFKALTYLHRYSRDLLAKLRTDYVHEQQERYRTQLSHITSALNTATGAERARLLKQQDKLTEQSREIGVYEEKVHHLADLNIPIDLDDGVKRNYEKFADVLAEI